MGILDRYIGFTIAYSTFFTLLILLSLFTFFTFAGELNNTRGAYDSFQALEFSVLTMPSMLYQIFPAAALIGTMSGLGTLAGNSELVAMRAAGYSLRRLLRSVFVFSFVLMLTVALIGEYLAPRAQTFAETRRSLAQSGGQGALVQGGVWLRDGRQFIHIGKIANNGRLEDVNIFHLNTNQRLDEYKEIASAVNLTGSHWNLVDYSEFKMDGDTVEVHRFDNTTDTTFISKNILNMVSVKPETMSAQAAYQYINYLEDNGIDASQYRQAFWMKVTTPLATFVMVMLAIPIVMGSIRTLTAGHRILIGTLTGIGFYLLSQVFAYIGLVYEFSPIVAALFPIVTFGLVAYRLMKRVR